MAGPEKAEQVTEQPAHESTEKSTGEQGVETKSETTKASEALLGEFLTTGKPEAANDNQARGALELPGLEISMEGGSDDVVQQKVRELEATRAGNVREIDANSGGKSGDRGEFNLHRALTDPNSGVMPELLREGKLGPEWALYPTQSGSPADKIGGDFYLVNKETGDFYLIDATTNENKQNKYRLREEGIIKFENRIFDSYGALRTDSDIPEIREEAQKFRGDLKDKILDLTGKRSPFRIGDMPMPSTVRLEPEEAKEKPKTDAELKRVSDWARDKSRNSDTYNPADYREMSQSVEKSRTQLEKTAREVSSAPLREKAEDVARRDIANYVFHGPESFEENYVKNRRRNPQKSDVVVLRDGSIRMEHDGNNLNGGTTGEVIETVMGEMAKTGALLAQLNGNQLKSLGVKQETINQFKKLKGEPRRKAIEDLISKSPDLRKANETMMERWFRYKGAIGSEGSYGDKRGALRESIKLGLRTADTYQLTGEEPPEKAKPAAEVEKPLTVHERSPLGKEAIAELQRYFVQTEGAHPGTEYNQDAHLALLEMEPKESWTDEQKKELKRLKDGYEAHNEAIVKEVNELVIPDRSQQGNEGATERAATERGAGEPVRTGQEHSTDVLADGNGARPVDANVLVTRFNADGTTSLETRPLSKLSHEEMARKFENIDQKIVEAREKGHEEAARELERYRDEYNSKKTARERLAYIEQVKQEARSISEHGTGIGGRIARGSSTAVAVMMLLDFALPQAHAEENDSSRVVPRGN